MREPGQTATGRKLLPRFLRIVLPGYMLIGVLVLVFVALKAQSQRKLIEVEQAHVVHDQHEIMQTVCEGIVTDLMVLASQLEMKAMVDDSSASTEASLASEFRTFAQYKRDYDQVRYIARSGREVLRVSRDLGAPVVVSTPDLQDKSARYYVKTALTLAPGQIYVSPLDLNIEHGKIEQPSKPTIRLATPVCDSSGQIHGIVVLNYLAANLLEPLRRVNRTAPGPIMLLDNAGYWLFAENSDDTFGFMFPDHRDRTLAQRDPGSWRQIAAAERGLFANARGFFAFATIRPIRSWVGDVVTDGASMGDVVSAADRYAWKLVSYVPRSQYRREVLADIRGWLVPILLVLVLLASVAWRLARSIERRNAAEQELRNLNEELEARVTERSSALVAATEARRRAESELRQSEKIRTLGTVAARIAHDFNNALEPILGFTELAQIGLPATAHVQQYLAAVTVAVGRASDLVREIQLFSSRAAPCLEKTALADIVQEVAAQTRSMAPSGVTIRVAIDPACPAVDVDRGQIHRALTNLCRNAVQAFERREGVVTIALGTSGEPRNSVRLAVVDDGPGIAPEIRERLFEPYATTRGRSGGSGLGLATVHGIVERHGGFIEVVSTPDEGTAFTVVLPVDAEKSRAREPVG